MFDFIPISEYTPYFHYTILILVLLVFWQCNSGIILNKRNVSLNAVLGVIFTFVLILYMGLRPVSEEFGDTINYAVGFYEMQQSTEKFHWVWEGEWLFHNVQHLFAKYSDIHVFFLFCSSVYIGCLWLAMKRIFRSYYYIPLLVAFSMFTFWTYGVNGIRNGMASSVIILAMTYTNKPQIMIVLALLAIGFHKSSILMMGACGVAWYIKNSRYYVLGWAASVVISLAVGSRIQGWLANLNILSDDDRFTGYLTGDNMIGELVQTEMIFRWDFVAYSFIAVAIGYYFIFIQKFKDEYYQWWYNSFLTMNAFWILIIRAAYSNRFAQISWFIMPVILIYPFLRKRFWINHERYLGLAILLFYAFAFYSNILKA